MFEVKIVEGARVPGKLADAELHFTSDGGGATDTDTLLHGLKLIGFAIWERRSVAGARNVTFPARTYAVNGERRTFALLRANGSDVARHSDAVKEAILNAYEAFGRGAARSGT